MRNLDEICNKLHFDYLKAPGTVIECIKSPAWSTILKVGDLYKVKESESVRGLITENGFIYLAHLRLFKKKE